MAWDGSIIFARALRSLKPSTRATYEDSIACARFGSVALADIAGDMLAALDADMVKDELSSSSRRNAHIVFRSVLRVAVDAGLLDALPKLPRLPKVGRRIPHSMHREDLEAILAKSSVRARLAFSLAAFAGLRRGEVTGLRWSDIDLSARARITDPIGQPREPDLPPRWPWTAPLFSRGR